MDNPPVAAAPPLPPIRVSSCLVLGGARSGKSRHALALAEASGLAPVFLATAAAWDQEMRERIALHRGERGAAWRTVEEPLDLVGALASEVRRGAVIVVDCLTLWLTNVMLGQRDMAADIERLAGAVAGLGGPVIFVSNEVGAGIVPDNAMARRFRDAQGRLNQAMAARCDSVVLVTAGLPRLLKPVPLPALHLGCPE